MEIEVGLVSDFEEGTIFSFEVNGDDVGVVCLRGRFYAFQNRCTHWGVALSEGYVNSANQVVCLYHDSAFDLATGAAVGGPAFDDLPLYNVRVEGERVYIRAPTPDQS
jgi:3-phenylpropionate/trans-cinnamate dioxygenase ferredoxin subunit